MTRTKSKLKTVTRSRPVKASQRKSSKRPAPVGGVSSALTKARSGTKNAQVVTMLRDQAGTTISSLMTATEWQQHSVRGFLAGVVRKRFGLDLVSEQTDKGRVYHIRDSGVSNVTPHQAKQTA